MQQRCCIVDILTGRKCLMLNYRFAVCVVMPSDLTWMYHFPLIPTMVIIMVISVWKCMLSGKESFILFFMLPYCFPWMKYNECYKKESTKPLTRIHAENLHSYRFSLHSLLVFISELSAKFNFSACWKNWLNFFGNAIIVYDVFTRVHRYYLT